MCCDCFIWCVSCTAIVLTCFVMYGCACVGFLMCECFVNMFTVFLLFVLFRLCIFILIFFVCTSVRTTATE